MRRSVSSLWIGPSLSLIEQLCVRSYLDHGHEFHLYTYRPVANVPEGATLRDAREILPESSVYRTKVNGLAAFSDYFRWSMLARQGGMWVDMDMICIRPFDFDRELVFGVESANGGVGNAILGFPEGHFLATILADACENVNRFQPIDSGRARVKKALRALLLGKTRSRLHVRHGEPGGPDYFTMQLRHHGLIDQAAPQDWFYPVNYWEWKSIYEPRDDIDAFFARSYAIHLWNNILTNDEGVDKNARNFAGSIIGALFDRHIR